MGKIYAVLLFATLLVACAKEKSHEEGEAPIGFDGRYVGVFSRTGIDTVSVTLNFQGDNFDGQSDREKYPAICHGSFTKDISSIVFSDSCAWTADFDWTLILNGSYSLASTDSTLRIWRTSGAVTDEYLLSRLTR